LPDIAGYFNVTVDELLGLKPLHQQDYIPRNTDNHDTSNGKENNLYKNRKYFWNDDYIEFLVRNVWKVQDFIDIHGLDKSQEKEKVYENKIVSFDGVRVVLMIDY
jgi:hypothetical protein